MDIQIILGDEKEKKAFIEDFTHKSLGDTIRFLTEDEESQSELLADFVYEDFIKCR